VRIQGPLFLSCNASGQDEAVDGYIADTVGHDGRDDSCVGGGE
jgi:hypothetical protein